MGIGGQETVLGKVAEGGAIPACMPVVPGTAPNQVKSPSAAGERALGIALFAAAAIGDQIDVIVAGPAVGIAAGPVNPDDYVKIGATNEIQVVTIGGSPTGGNFTLTYSGQTTGNITYNASAATVQAALEALSNIDPGDVAVSGADGGPYTVIFQGVLAGTNVAQMTASGAGLTPSGTVTIATLVQGGFKGRLLPTTTAADEVVGRVLSAAAQDGDEFSLLVQCQKY